MQSMYGVLPYPLGTSHRYGQTTVCRSCSFAFHMSSPYCCDNLTKCVYCCTMCHCDSRSNDIYIYIAILHYHYHTVYSLNTFLNGYDCLYSNIILSLLYPYVILPRNNMAPKFYVVFL